MLYGILDGLATLLADLVGPTLRTTEQVYGFGRRSGCRTRDVGVRGVRPTALTRGTAKEAGVSQTVTRRSILRLFGLGAAAAAIAACSAPAATPMPAKPAEVAKPAGTAPSTTQAPATAPATKAKEPITLRLWHWDAVLIEPYDREAAIFKQQFPYVTVKVKQTDAAEYPQKVTAAVAGGSPPDVIGVTVTRADFLTFASKGQLTPLMPYIQRDKFDLDDFYPLNLKQHQWKGLLYSLPYAWNTQVWFYNIDMFKREGLKTPTEYWREGQWSWNTYKELAAKLTKGSGTDKYWGSGNIMPNNTAAFLPMVWTNGGELFDPQYTKALLTEQATFGAFEFVYDVKKSAPGPEDAKTGTIESGRLGMWPNWDIWYELNIGRVPFKYQIVPPPAAKGGGKHFFTGNAPGFGIPKGVKHPDESWELIKFLLSPESLTRLFLAANNTPSRRSLSTSKELWAQNKSLPDPSTMWETAKAKEANAKNPPKISTWAQMSTAMSEEMTLVWADKQSLSDGVKKVADRWNKLLQGAEVDPDVQ